MHNQHKNIEYIFILCTFFFVHVCFRIIIIKLFVVLIVSLKIVYVVVDEHLSIECNKIFISQIFEYQLIIRIVKLRKFEKR